MIPSIETYMVVSLAFAVFAAVTAIGASLVLGVGYERLRLGLEKVKEGLDLVNRQSGFFSNAIYKLEKNVDALDERQQIFQEETVADTKRTESLIQHAENLVIQANHEIRQMKVDEEHEPDDTIDMPSVETAKHAPQPLNPLYKEDVSREQKTTAMTNFALFGRSDKDIRFM